MKILKEGIIFKTWYGECRNCGSIIKASSEDFRCENLVYQKIQSPCSYCGALLTFYREDTTVGDNIRLSV